MAKGTRRVHRPNNRPQSDADRERELRARMPDGPVVIVKKEPSDTTEDEFQTLFETEAGEFQIRKRLKPNLGIKYLKIVREKGATEAVAEMLFLVLGDDAMNELAENDDIGDEEMDQIMATVEYKLLEASKSTLGN